MNDADRLVQAEGELAHPPRALVERDHLLAGSPRRCEAVASTTSPAWKRRRTSSTCRPRKTAGNVKRISPSALVVERSREDLAVREVLVPIGRDPGAVSADDKGQVGALGDEAQLLLRAQELDHALQLVREGAPAGDRIAVVEQRGIEDEVLVLGERHLGVLSRRRSSG